LVTTEQVQHRQEIIEVNHKEIHMTEATQKLKFEFTTDEANLTLNALAQLPFAQVAGLIETIKVQAAPQLQPAAPVVEETDAPPVFLSE
jgi:hypothetical protein